MRTLKKLVFIVDWLKLGTWAVMFGSGISSWAFLIGCASSDIKLGGVVSNPAYYCPHDISDEILERIQRVTPVYPLSWNELQKASQSRRTTYGFTMGDSVWIYENLNDPEETLYHEYCHLYELFYMGGYQDDPHVGWLSSPPYKYDDQYSRIDVSRVKWIASQS